MRFPTVDESFVSFLVKVCRWYKADLIRREYVFLAMAAVLNGVRE